MAVVLQERLEELAASDVNFQYLSEVAGGADPWSTPVCFTDWIELAGLHRSLTRGQSARPASRSHLLNTDKTWCDAGVRVCVQPRRTVAC